jgi:hypothetical protein
MSLAIDHAIVNILFKNLNDPLFKDYYTLDEINAEFIEYEGAKVEITRNGSDEILPAQFHMRYVDYLTSLHCSITEESGDDPNIFINEFLQMSTVV